MNFTKTIVNAVMTWVNKRFKENTPDWSLNDPSADGYIRNRPFYIEPDVVKVVLNRSLDFTNAGNVDWGQTKSGYILEGFADMSLNVGGTYFVQFNGIEYETVAFKEKGYGNVIIGNGAFVDDSNDDNGLPFVFGNYSVGDDYLYAIVSSNATHVIKISTFEEKVKKIDAKYLPDLPDMDYVSYEKWQDLTEDQMAIARENIGAGTSNFSGSYTDLTNQPDIPRYVVQYNTNQSLTDDDKSRARNNIDAVSKDQVLSVTEQQTLTDRQKELARANIGASDFDGNFESLVGAPNVMTLDTEQNLSDRKVLNFGQEQYVDSSKCGLEINSCMWKDTDGEVNCKTVLGLNSLKITSTNADGTSKEMYIGPGKVSAGMNTIEFQRNSSVSGQTVRIINLLEPVNYHDAATKGYVDNAIAEVGSRVEVDPTLSIEGMAADAAAVGELANKVIPMSKGGTGATDGATGLRNMFADGKTILSAHQYGKDMPSDVSVGQVFFQEATGTIADIGQDVAKALRAVNLLDNSNFCNPINQRGISGTYTGTSNLTNYFLDRWATWSNLTHYTIDDDGLTITSNYSGSLGPWQVFENPEKMLGKTYTLAVCYDNDVIDCGSVTIPNATKDSDYYLTAISTASGKVGFRFFVEADLSRIYAQIMIASGDSHKIKWVACYEGDYTVETLPPYIPKGYAAELVECQRYYENSWFGCPNGKNTRIANSVMAWSATQADAYIPYKVTKRIQPTVTFYNEGSNSSWTVYHGGQHRATSSISNINRYGVNKLTLRINRDSTADTTDWTAGDSMEARGHWEASADL